MVTKELARHCYNHYKLDHDGDHGWNHWMRVLNAGLILAEHEGANQNIVKLFAILHDVERNDEYRDKEHGLRAAFHADTLRGKMFDISSRDMGILKEAMIYHSDGYTDHDDITVKVCWDADRLDLGRVGITPNPKKMCTATAKSFTM